MECRIKAKNDYVKLVGVCDRSSDTNPPMNSGVWYCHMDITLTSALPPPPRLSRRRLPEAENKNKNEPSGARLG